MLVACSGGADSLALAAATAFEAPRAGLAAGLLTVDHGLQDGSAEQARRVAALGYELGFDPVEVLRVEVCGPGGPEAAARTVRYAALDAAAEALDAGVLLGHTLDDQAETVLLGLGRGSGPRSVAGMAAADGRRLRPFLGLRRSVTVAACAALGLVPWDDPHNTDPSFQRVRLRTEVLPLLEDTLQGGVAEALARTAELLRDDLDALDAWAATVLPEVVRAGPRQDDTKRGQVADVGGEVSVDGLAELPRAVRTRVLRSWLQRAGVGELTAERTRAVDALVTDWHGQGPLDLPGGAAVRRTSDRLVLYAPPARPRERRV
ncbi:MAG TPA: tRNA lysidine(34) synthetase TilS [Jatrophihabitans sp.]|nr:tRNA lysidine(34) synthetase TilS [Jatrophihabitans sp.]